MNFNGTWQQPVAEQLSDVDAPHPATYAKVEVREMTEWMPSDDAKPVPKSKEMSVKCCVAEEIILDSYDGQISLKPIVKHRFYDARKKNWDKDVATTELSADRYMTIRTQTATIPGIKDRFGKAIDAYERRLVKDGRPLPIVLLADKVYPAAINACESMAISSIEALATSDKQTIAKLEEYLRKSGQSRIAAQVKRFQELACTRLDNLGVVYEKPEGKSAPKKAA
jgi:hypothetical protein